MQRSVVFAATLALLSGCAHRVGRLEINRFQHEEFPYAVFYVPDGEPTAPLGGQWRVDNFTLPANSHRYVAKRGPEYEIERRYDVDGDGKPEGLEREPFYDLLLLHTQKDASMWVRSVPVSSAEKDKELAVFAERYVESVAGTGVVAVRFGSEGAVGSVGRRFASRVLHSESCTLSKREAYRVDFEVANVDQLQLSDQARWQRAAVVFVRTGYSHRVQNVRGVSTRFPVVMALGLSAKPQDFAALEPDFEKLLKQTVLGDEGKGLSMNGETTCNLSSPAEGSGAEAAPPEEAPNEAAQIPLAPEAMPQPEATPASP
jgi:hypothetical protein